METEARPAFARFLRYWRHIKSWSQEKLAHKIQASPRHVIRLENGDSKPSVEMLERLIAAFKLGERDSNHLRLSAGFNAVSNYKDIYSKDFKWLRKTAKVCVDCAGDNPSVANDIYGNILWSNAAWNELLHKLNIGALQAKDNYYQLLFSEGGIGDYIEDKDSVLSLILMNLKQNLLFREDKNAQAQFDEIIKLKHTPQNWETTAAALEPRASFRMVFNIDKRQYRYFNVSQIINSQGPAAYLSEPYICINTLHQEDKFITPSQ